MKASLSLNEQREGAAGMYPHHITWLDDEKKCKTCGQTKEHEKHSANAERQSVDSIIEMLKSQATGFKAGKSDGTAETVVVQAKESNTGFHKFEPSVNEVSRLYKRMRGLVTVVFKKECGDLPEKEYRDVHVQNPSKRQSAKSY